MANKAQKIRIINASEHNLKNISLDIPHQNLIVVTGVSGSGKSSLVFDVIASEGQRRYLETYASFSRQFMGKMSRPNVDSINGLMPVISISQKTIGANIRSTLGTMSDIYDMLRLLYARIGKTDEDIKLTRSLFSFNTPQGACKQCNGIGLEEKIDIDKLITDPKKSLREGVLAPTLPNGYIMYSQVTIDVLDTVCSVHGFDVNTPWQELSEDQKNVILNGSTRIKVPFGKHSLESRLKWTGITAKPREEGYYKGMIPIMADILRRDRNANILRYVKSVKCSLCNGNRLNSHAMSVNIHGKNISELNSMELSELKKFLENIVWDKNEINIATPIVKKIIRQIILFDKLGMNHLALSRTSNSLTGGESQRIRLINQVSAELSNVLYVFDEPSVGMHSRDMQHLIDIFNTLVQQGNTVIVVEHDPATILQADWIIDIGPGAGKSGGELLFNGSLNDFLSSSKLLKISPTRDILQKNSSLKLQGKIYKNKENILLNSCNYHNLKNIDVIIKNRAFNVICGVSGSGKASLVYGVLEPAIVRYLNDKKAGKECNQPFAGSENIDKLIRITQSPIGRTPRSNPATYTKLSDRIRDVFSALPKAKEMGFKKSHFSFNTKGGRCETCMGAGKIQIGMHFLGNIDIVCATCNGKRFKSDILQVKYKEKNISQIFELTVNQAIEFFSREAKVLKYLQTLADVGLGYITLGQASTTLSGGEAQRIKLAAQLQQRDTGNTMYIIDEPGTGLHTKDIQVLLIALRKLVENGNTIVCLEHDTDIIMQADHVVELGPESGANGGRIVFQGSPVELLKNPQSYITQAINNDFDIAKTPSEIKHHTHIELNGVNTHLLKNIDVSIPKNALTIITGVSGSGKSSLAFDTLFAEARSRFSESLSTYVRGLLQQSNPAKIQSSSGLSPVVAVSRKHLGHSVRSTVGTLTGIYDHYRLLYSRLAQLQGKEYTAQHFSFNNQMGACPVCDGLGVKLTTNPHKLISQPELPITDDCMKASRLGKYYGDPNGRYIAIIKKIAEVRGYDLSIPWLDLSDEIKEYILYGTGDIIWKLVWTFKNKTRTGTQELSTKWEGFCNIIDDEYRRKHQNRNIEAIANLLHEVKCETCNGSRLKCELNDVLCMGKSISELTELNVNESIKFFNDITQEPDNIKQSIINEISAGIKEILDSLQDLGLNYLCLNRSASTLSGGEAQRVRIAGILSAKLYGVCYVLDEPTIGLHANDTKSLISVLKRLVSEGNTVVVVEHDELFIRMADYIIEMGPGAGNMGGNIVATGSLKSIMNNHTTLTSKFLNTTINHNAKTRDIVKKSFGVKSAFANNLKNIDVDFISGGIIAINGVSGSGKSSLIYDVLYKSAKAKQAIACKTVYGLSQFNKIISVNQQALSNNSLSTPATFTGILDDIRTIFAKTTLAKELGFKKNAFSYFNKEGKCPVCSGHGEIRTSMDFMSDIWNVCDLCKGNRYKENILQVKYNNKSIADVLQLTISNALMFFNDYPILKNKLEICESTGIGHLQLGQAGNTLSGGESQRLKLASEMMKEAKGNNLFLLDEPTTGLHYFDIVRLMDVFNDLADKGHTIIFVEHNPYLTNIANQKITLGYGSGPDGGEII